MTARWTRETFSLVCEVLFEADGLPDRDKAMDVLNALADRHLLVEPGSETSTQYGREVFRDGVSLGTWECGWKLASETVAEHAEAKAQDPAWRGSARVVTRTVRTGPWRAES